MPYITFHVPFAIDVVFGRAFARDRHVHHNVDRVRHVQMQVGRAQQEIAGIASAGVSVSRIHFRPEIWFHETGGQSGRQIQFAGVRRVFLQRQHGHQVFKPTVVAETKKIIMNEPRRLANGSFHSSTI